MDNNTVEKLFNALLPVRFPVEERQAMAQQIKDNDTWYEDPELFENVAFAYEQESVTSRSGNDSHDLYDTMKATEFFSSEHFDHANFHIINHDTGIVLFTPFYVLDQFSTDEDVQEIHNLIEKWTQASQPFVKKHGNGESLVKINKRSEQGGMVHPIKDKIILRPDGVYVFVANKSTLTERTRYENTFESSSLMDVLNFIREYRATNRY